MRTLPLWGGEGAVDGKREEPTGGQPEKLAVRGKGGQGEKKSAAREAKNGIHIEADPIIKIGTEKKIFIGGTGTCRLTWKTISYENGIFSQMGG